MTERGYSQVDVDRFVLIVDRDYTIELCKLHVFRKLCSFCLLQSLICRLIMLSSN